MGKIFRPTWESVKKHGCPSWYEEAKLGIFIHWGLYSVPGWAPTSGELGAIPWEKWFTVNPYAEWYENTLRIVGSPTFSYHQKTYGEDFPYERFVEEWKAEHWDPTTWAKLFREIGARYVVLTTKHHEGFCLWPSEYSDFTVHRRGPRRDIVGELTEAVRREGLRMGLYYSGLLDWHFTHEPIRILEDLWTLYPQTYAYADYAYDQWVELIVRYHPDILWNDIGWPKKGEDFLPYLFSFYYNFCPEGVVNDRWAVPPVKETKWADYRTAEYLLNRPETIVPYKWEMCRGLGFSFGYNRNEGEEHVISLKDLVMLLVDVVSKNGNLLLNVGPRADGTIPEIQVERLRGLGKWLAINGEAIFATHPWVRAEGTTAEGIPLRFTEREEHLYLILLGEVEQDTLRIPSLLPKEGMEVKLLGEERRVEWKKEEENLFFLFPSGWKEQIFLFPVLRLTPPPLFSP